MAAKDKTTDAGAAVAKERAHKATYATDKKKGGYLVRVQGPMAERFAGREVPVTRRNGEEGHEKLTKLLWTGKDEDSGQPVALYTFEAKPRDTAEVEVEF